VTRPANVDSRARDILERAVRSIAEQAAKTNEVIDEAMEAGLAVDHPVTVAAKMLRLELLKTNAELERGLSVFVLDSTSRGMEVHWVQDVSVPDHSHWGTPLPSTAGRAGVVGHASLRTPDRLGPPVTGSAGSHTAHVHGYGEWRMRRP
jgi:hypothetical protein